MQPCTGSCTNTQRQYNRDNEHTKCSIARTHEQTYTCTRNQIVEHTLVRSCTRALAHGDPFVLIIKRRRRRRVYKRRVIDRIEIKKICEMPARISRLCSTAGGQAKSARAPRATSDSEFYKHWERPAIIQNYDRNLLWCPPPHIFQVFVFQSVPEKNQRLIPIGLAILRTLAKSDFRSRAPFGSQRQKTPFFTLFGPLQSKRPNESSQTKRQWMRQRQTNKTVYSQLPGNVYKSVKGRREKSHTSASPKLCSLPAPKPSVRFERNFLRGYLLFDGQHDAV